jgi:hypothetical protein
MSAIPYDPRQLVQLAQDLHPKHPWLAPALASCTAGHFMDEGEAFFCFVDSRAPMSSGAPPEPGWREQGLWLLHPRDGWMLLDIAADGRVLGLVYHDRLTPMDIVRAP